MNRNAQCACHHDGGVRPKAGARWRMEMRMGRRMGVRQVPGVMLGVVEACRPGVP